MRLLSIKRWTALAAALAGIAGVAAFASTSGGYVANPAQIWTVAGNGVNGFTGDTGPAT
jgi:hypothetical protein